jgi:hypothetical protein
MPPQARKSTTVPTAQLRPVTAQQLVAAHLVVTSVANQLDTQAAALRAQLATIEAQQQQAAKLLDGITKRITTEQPDLHRILIEPASRRQRA